MKIRFQSYLLLLSGIILIALTGYITVSHLKHSDAITQKLQQNQKRMILLNDFQVISNQQVLYSVDLIRTKDLSGERIIPYRMTETRLTREIENLNDWKVEDPSLSFLLDPLIDKGQKLATLCKEELMDPLYTHNTLDEGVIELLIYTKLNGLATDINAVRSHLGQQIRKQVLIQAGQKRNLLTLYLPALGSFLLFFFIITFLIISRTVSSINKTRAYLGTLAEGQERLDVSLPEKGRDEISLLCRNFNIFMANLNSRHKALKEVAGKQLFSGSQLKQISQEHASAVTQINQSLDAVDNHTREMSVRVESSAEEVDRIALSLDSLEKMSRNQKRRVSGMIERGREVYDDLASQQAAIAQQVLLTEHVRKEGLNNQKILGLLKNQINGILLHSKAMAEAILSIQDLADQTDILAINASIEAAHAGGYGKGFSVVSGEMRNLSNKVRDNTSMVSDLLTELNVKLELMAEEEKQNRDSMIRLVGQNKDAEDVIRQLNSSMKNMQSTLGDFSQILEDVRTGSVTVHDETELLRASGNKISYHVTEIRNKQKGLQLEWSEMTQGVCLLAEGTATLSRVSDDNKQAASVLNDEIRMLGS